MQVSCTLDDPLLERRCKQVRQTVGDEAREGTAPQRTLLEDRSVK